MRTDTVLKVEAFDLLTKQLGEVDAERFIAIIKNDNFDYTKWRSNIFAGMSIEEIHRQATQFEKNTTK
ncbi:MAG: hypothetical protein LBO69_01870 [Ignavibacteria bacterium]|jgi:hypothetical protein|nr:hypothetical protein [Ignavibacteria bacterium]